MTPLPLSPEYYPFIISQQPWKMNTGLQRPIVLQQTGSWCALFNEVNYIIASINLAVVHATKSLLTCKSATAFDVHLISEEGRHDLRRGWSPGERRGKGESEQAHVPGVCADEGGCGGVARPQGTGGGSQQRPLILSAKLLR